MEYEWLWLVLLGLVSAYSAQNFQELKAISMTIHLPLNGSKITLQCANNNSGSTVRWLHNSKPLLSHESTGIFEFSQPDQTSGVKMNISFLPTQNLNNTNLTCNVYHDIGHLIATYSAILKIEDVPLPPNPRISVTNGDVVYVNWDAPYTGTKYHITGYDITIQLTNGITVPRSLGNNNLSFNYTLNYVLTECTYVTVSLTANNMVGRSTPGTITQLLPTVPEDFQLGTQITYTSNYQPHIRASFKFPALCESSNATYFLQLYDEQDQIVFTSEEKTRSHSGAETSIYIQNDSVNTDSKYTVVVIVRTSAGSMNASQSIDTTHNGTKSTESKPQGLIPRISSNYYIMIGTVGGFIILQILIIVIVTGILCLKRKLKSRKIVCSETVLTRMVPNPVYDTQTSAIYEEIPHTNNGFLQPSLADEGYTSVSTTPEQVRAPTSNLKTASQADNEEEYRDETSRHSDSPAKPPERDPNNGRPC